MDDPQCRGQGAAHAGQNDTRAHVWQHGHSPGHDRGGQGIPGQTDAARMCEFGRRMVLEAFGAEVVITPPHESTDGAIRAARDIFSSAPDRYFMPDQFTNPSNILAHYESTGPEIYEQTNGEVDVFVAGMGTTGTLMGVAKFLQQQKPSVRIVGIEPTKGHSIQGLKNMEESMVPAIYDRGKLDEVITIGDGIAFETARRLAVEEGIFTGISSGAAVAGALQLAQNMSSGTIVVLLPDRGDRYLSTTLFRSICAKCPP